MTAIGGKELYEHLEVLAQAVDGTLAEASLDYVVDALLRISSAGCSKAADQRRAHTTRAVARWQAVHRPIRDPEEGK